MCQVSDHHEVADDGRQIVRGVYHGTVLDIGASTDIDGAGGASQHRLRPYARVGRKCDVSYNRGLWMDKGGRVDVGLRIADGVDGHFSSCCSVSCGRNYLRASLESL